MPDLVSRLLDGCVEDPNGCWITTNRKAADTGYIKMNHRIGGNSHMVLGHRISFEYFRSEIPDGLVLDHLCRNRACVNPWHLEPVTHQVNILRGSGASARNALVESCPQGHPYDHRNTYRKNGSRHCRACMRDGQRRRGRTKRSSAPMAARVLNRLSLLADSEGRAPLSIQQTAGALGVGFTSIRRAVYRLVEDGAIRKVKSNRGPIPAVYELAPSEDGWTEATPDERQVAA